MYEKRQMQQNSKTNRRRKKTGILHLGVMSLQDHSSKPEYSGSIIIGSNWTPVGDNNR